MEYPCLVYKAPGRNKGPKGATYDHITVDNDEELVKFKGQGWFTSLPAALEAAVREESLKKLQEMDKAPTPPPPAPPAPKGPKK